MFEGQKQLVKDVISEVKTAEAITDTARGLKGPALLMALLDNPRAVAFAVVACFFGGVIGMYMITRALHMFR